MQSQQSPAFGQNRQYAEHELVFMMGEELKKPLTAIKALAELDRTTTGTSQTITLEARKALRTIDNVLTYQRLNSDQLSLDIGPVHIGSALTQVATDLQPLSISKGCETEVFIQSGLSSVEAHPDALKSGIESLWQAVLGMTSRPSAMTWHVYRSPGGIRIALTNSSLELSRVAITSHTEQVGSSRQPFAGIPGPATDFVTAYNLFSLLGGNLRKIHKQGKPGFAVTLPLSTQLAFV